MRSSSEVMYRARQVSNLGGFMSGVNNNGAHSANGITAMFIATGQDAANVAESSAAFVYAELRDNGDYYYSVTIPSLIVATYGGGTGAGHAARVPRAARLLRQGQGAQVHGDRRRHRALRRALARLGDRRGGVGQRPRPPGRNRPGRRTSTALGREVGERSGGVPRRSQRRLDHVPLERPQRRRSVAAARTRPALPPPYPAPLTFAPCRPTRPARSASPAAAAPSAAGAGPTARRAGCRCPARSRGRRPRAP